MKLTLEELKLLESAICTEIIERNRYNDRHPDFPKHFCKLTHLKEKIHAYIMEIQEKMQMQMQVQTEDASANCKSNASEMQTANANQNAN